VSQQKDNRAQARREVVGGSGRERSSAPAQREQQKTGLVDNG